ncbi:MAG: MFS transporter [Caldilineaceae bacterium]
MSTSLIETPAELASEPPASRPPTTSEKMRGLPWSVFTNLTNTFFVQFTFFGSVFVLFLNQLGLDKGQIGFLLSPVHFAGLIALFVAPFTARFGYKRTFVTFYAARKIIAAFLIITPWIAANFGTQGALYYVAGVTTLFALVRAIEETAYYPWVQEFVPNAIRGKYSAASSIATTASGFIAVTIASYVIGITSGYGGFQLLIGVGVLIGLLSAWASSHIPGGAPIPVAQLRQTRTESMWTTLRDANFRRYLLGASAFVLATLPLASFLPLYMREQVGLNESQVILVQTGGLLGGLASSYLWGWAADRYGSKPVMLVSVFVALFLPLCWWVIPRHVMLSLYIALAISFVQGITDIGWAIGAGRLFFVNVVPTARNSDYTAVHFAWIGLVAGISQLVGGQVLQFSQNLTGGLPFLPLDPYTPLLLLNVSLALAALLILRNMRADNTVGVLEFAGIFFRGNPFRAMSSLLRYNLFSSTEQTAVLNTERLGWAQSALTVDELLEALHDPRFSVRFEAIISIARMRPHPRLTAALAEVLDGSEVALSVIAAWALGRIGDPAGIPSLRKALDTPYRSIRAHSVRALGLLNDQESAELLLTRFQDETDKGLRMAYAAAFGHLKYAPAVPPMLTLLHEMANPGARLELALDLARMGGKEAAFVSLHRQAAADESVALAAALTQVKQAIARKPKKKTALLVMNQAMQSAPFQSQLTNAIDHFASGRRGVGVQSLVEMIQQLPTEPKSIARQLLHECAAQLTPESADRREYLLLAIYMLSVIAQE